MKTSCKNSWKCAILATPISEGQCRSVPVQTQTTDAHTYNKQTHDIPFPPLLCAPYPHHSDTSLSVLISCTAYVNVVSLLSGHSIWNVCLLYLLSFALHLGFISTKTIACRLLVLPAAECRIAKCRHLNKTNNHCKENFKKLEKYLPVFYLQF